MTRPFATPRRLESWIDFLCSLDKLEDAGPAVVHALHGSLTPALLACYYPLYDSGDDAGFRYGIYFFIRKILELSYSRSIPIEALLRTVAVHELFHAHMNWRLPEGGRGHSHTAEGASYCRLEEAAANRVAIDWLKDAGYPESTVEHIKDALFRRFGSVAGGGTGGGLPGYGEYHLLDEDVTVVLPEMVGTSSSHILPERYATGKALYQWGFSPRRRDSALWWSWLVENIDRGAVPMYFDLS